MHRRALCGLVAAGLCAPSARRGPFAAPGAVGGVVAAEVHIDNFVFTPDTLTVAVGTMVKFTNRDDLPHSVVNAERPPIFKSKTLDTDESFSVTFDKPGQFAYFCGLHPHMKGVVVVA